MNATIMAAREYGTDRPCEVGRITYRKGYCDYVALAYRYTDDGSDWFLTWVGEVGRDTARLPRGVAPSDEMRDALDTATYEAAA